jgi:hypothetical protein
MLKINKLCNVCDQVTKNPKLLKDIFNTKYYLKGSSVSLKELWDDYTQANGNQFSYEALRNHVKKHQFMSEKDFNSRHLRQIAKDAEKQLLKRQIESGQVWEEVINQGMEKLQNGELHMKTGDLLKAAKDKSDYEMKVKDQQIAMMDMVMHFASGENNESKSYDRRIIEGEAVTDFDAAGESPGSVDEGANGSSGIYYPPTWDAVAPGADPLPAGNDF